MVQPGERQQLAARSAPLHRDRLIARLVERGDNGSRDLLEDILKGQEEHADWLETQHQLIRHVGTEPYLAQQIHD